MRNLLSVLLLCCVASAVAQSSKPRARDLGLSPGIYPPGPLNAITDVAGVKVGHVTLIQGDTVRTGVTAIVPHAGNVFQDKVAGAVFVGNAFGKLAGSTQVEELGTIETPIALTNTLSVGAVVEGLVRYTLAQPGNENVRSVNAVVGETNDGGLNDIRGLHVRPEHALEAIKNAAGGRVTEGSVGAGTGTRCYGWKGGIGSASRVLPESSGGYTLGVLVQTNFGGQLTIGGAPVGRELRPNRISSGDDAGARRMRQEPDVKGTVPLDELGSCMIVVATDAPVDARDLKRIAARAVYGLGRTGSSYSNGSGDFAIAFTTSPEMRTAFNDSKPRRRMILPPDGVSPLFQAALEATEEAVYNSLFQATTVKDAEAIPVEKVKEILKKYGVGR